MLEGGFCISLTGDLPVYRSLGTNHTQPLAQIASRPVKQTLFEVSKLPKSAIDF